MTQVFVGDIGTEIALDCGVNISTATVRNILVLKPSGAKVVWPAAAEGVTGIVYETLADDLDEEGIYLVQSYIEMPGWKGQGNVASFSVMRGIA